MTNFEKAKKAGFQAGYEQGTAKERERYNTYLTFCKKLRNEKNRAKLRDLLDSGIPAATLSAHGEKLVSAEKQSRSARPVVVIPPRDKPMGKTAGMVERVVGRIKNIKE